MLFGRKKERKSKKESKNESKKESKKAREREYRRDQIIGCAGEIYSTASKRSIDSITKSKKLLQSWLRPES